TGNGVPAPVPEIAVHPTSHDFGDVIVDSTASQTFVVTNEGTAVLVVTATSLTGANPEQFNIDSGGAPFTLVPGDSQDVVVSFQPTSEGLKAAALQIASNDPDEDTLEVVLTGNGVGLLEIMVNIMSPNDGAIICTDSIGIEGAAEVSGGVPPFSIACEVNGIMAGVSEGNFMTTVPLSTGDNLLVATCTVVDGRGSQSLSSDTISVFLDDIAPTCSFTHEGNAVKGTFFDEHSGIATILATDLTNGTLTVDPFTPGDNSVDFRIDPINPNKGVGFNIEITDVCGNTFICDPVYLSLLADSENRQFELTFPNLDRYFQLTNHGLTEIRVDLNGYKFSLISDPIRAEEESSAYFMPKEGGITIDLIEYLHEGENKMHIVYEGLPGTSAELFLLDSVQGVDYVLELQTLPVEFHLAQNYPNPFNPTTKIQFDLPDRLSDGVHVQLRIYNLLGKLVRVLVDEHRFAGQYIVEWNGKDEHGRFVASGIYLYQLVARDFKQTKQMVLLK
ncbi:MAG: choice-of-anchor D domain-containing protein, partial [bacterium]